MLGADQKHFLLQLQNPCCFQDQPAMTQEVPSLTHSRLTLPITPGKKTKVQKFTSHTMAW